jgi:hypothetical protein
MRRQKARRRGVARQARTPACRVPVYGRSGLHDFLHGDLDVFGGDGFRLGDGGGEEGVVRARPLALRGKPLDASKIASTLGGSKRGTSEPARRSRCAMYGPISSRVRPRT